MVTHRTVFECPYCEEVLDYHREAEGVGFCSCGYNTADDDAR